MLESAQQTGEVEQHQDSDIVVVQDQDVLLKKVYGNVWDAFWDAGWSNWTRYCYKPNGEIIHLKGKYINATQKTQLKNNTKELIDQKLDEGSF